MQKRTSIAKLDPVQNARRVVDALIQRSEGTGPAGAISEGMVSRIMAEMGRKGGQIGGKRRLETLSDARRQEIASQAAKARWAKAKKRKGKARTTRA
jgi:hypothetical protein